VFLVWYSVTSSRRWKTSKEYVSHKANVRIDRGSQMLCDFRLICGLHLALLALEHEADGEDRRLRPHYPSSTAGTEWH